MNRSYKIGCMPMLTSFFVISMFCFVITFAPLQWILGGIYLPQLFAAAVLMSLIMTVIAFFSLRDISPSKSMLVERVKVRDLEAQFSNDAEWQNFKSQIQVGDEIWQWAAWGMMWFWLGGHHGYVIVRDDRVTNHYFVRP